MGYDTRFDGQVSLKPKLNKKQVAYLQAFSYTRRVQRDAQVVESLDDPIRLAAELPVGIKGGYYVGSTDDGMHGQAGDVSVTSGNEPAEGQPSLWCDWTATDNGKAIIHNDGEKFYHYDLWMVYLVEHFLKPWGIVANGTILWQGEDMMDRGQLVVTDNRVGVKALT